MYVGSHARDEKVSLAFNVDHGESRRDERPRDALDGRGGPPDDAADAEVDRA